MDKKTEALKLALEWHEWIHSGKSVGYAPCCSNDVMNSIREALEEQPAQDQGQSCYCSECERLSKELAAFKAQQQCMEHGECFGGECIYPAQQPAQQQEPVAWLYPDNLGRKIVWLGAKKPIIPRPDTAEPLYTSPQPAQQHEPVFKFQMQLKPGWGSQYPTPCVIGDPDLRSLFSKIGDVVTFYTSPPASKLLTDEQWQSIADTLGCIITRGQKDIIEAVLDIKENT